MSNPDRFYVECSCSSPEHVLRFSTDIEYKIETNYPSQAFFLTEESATGFHVFVK